MAQERTSEILGEDLDKKLDKFFSQHIASCQLAKKFYRSRIEFLGNFGIVVVGKKLKYPTDRLEKVTAIKKLIDFSDGMAAGTSPFTDAWQAENEIDFAATLLALPGIITLIADYAQSQLDSETLCEERNTIIEPVIQKLIGQIEFVKDYFVLTPRKAGAWGATIDESKQPAKKTTLKVKEASTNRAYGVDAGSIVENSGTGKLDITKGKLETGVPITLMPGDKWKFAFGYFIISVSNSSLTDKGALSYFKN